MFSKQRNCPPRGAFHNVAKPSKVKKNARGKVSFSKALGLLEQLKDELELYLRLIVPIFRLKKSIGEELVCQTLSDRDSLNIDTESWGSDSDSSYSAAVSSTDLTSFSSHSMPLADEEAIMSNNLLYANDADIFTMDMMMDVATPRAQQHAKPVPLYQCTFIFSNGRLCPFSTKTRCDWVKHQGSDKYYPQKRYMCLHCIDNVQGQDDQPLCAFCFEPLPGPGLPRSRSVKLYYLLCGQARKKDKHIFAANQDDHLRNHLRSSHSIVGIRPRGVNMDLRRQQCLAKKMRLLSRGF